MKLLYFVLIGTIALFSSYLINSENFQEFSQVFAQSDREINNFEDAQTTSSSETSIMKKEEKKPTLIRQTQDSKIHPSISKILQNANPAAMAKMLGAKTDGDKLYVYVYLDERIQNKALDIEILRQDKNIIVSKLTLSQIQSLANSDLVERITLPHLAVPFDHGGSEGVPFSLADQMHAAGFDGTGVKVAVIDTDFFLNGTHISDNIVFNWTSPLCDDLTCDAPEGGSHGTAVAEIVADMAPGIELYVYSIFDSIDFDDAVDNAIANDVDIITASLGFPTIPGQNEFYRDGTSSPAQKVNEARNNQTLVTIAAGNDGQVHWSGFYTPNATRVDGQLESELFIDELFGINYESVMMFNSSATNSSMQACLPIKYHNGTQIMINWSAFPETNQDYDFLIYDSIANQFLGTSAFGVRIEDGDDEPFIPISALTTTDPQDVCLIIASAISDENHLFHIDIGTGDPAKPNRFNLPEFDSGKFGQLSTPADAQGALTIGAINFKTNATDYSDDEIELYSSRGPTDDARTKPEICGPDKTSNTQILFNGGIFSGTSGATPHVAGAAALLLEQDRSLNVTQLEQKLIDLARNDIDFSQDNLCGSDSGSLSLETLVNFCTPEESGNWTITSDCTLNPSHIAPEYVIVENNALLTIPPGVTLDINFTTSNLIMQEGGMVLVKKGGELT